MSSRGQLLLQTLVIIAIFLLAAVAPQGLNGFASVCAAAPPTTSSPSPEEIRKQTTEIIARPEFRRVREKRSLSFSPSAPATSSWSYRFWKWVGDKVVNFMDWLSKLFGKSGVSGGSVSAFVNVMVWIVYALLAAIAGWMVWLLFKRVRQYVLDKRAKPLTTFEEGDVGIAPGELDADEYLRRAAELAQAGNYREAIAQLILGGKSHTERLGLIRYRRGLTHRDYLRALRARPPQQAAFKTIVGVYEPICFGRRPAEANHYQTSVSGYESGFGRV